MLFMEGGTGTVSPMSKTPSALHEGHLAKIPSLCDHAIDFLIVIPLLKTESYLDFCLSSIFSQQGDFVLRVHIQTADQSGGVQRQVVRWQQWLQTFGPKTGGRHLTVSAEPDSSGYDAVARGVDTIGPADDWIMSWLGADDVLLPGALMTLQSVMREHPQIRWITGLSFVASADGTNYTPAPPQHFSRYNLAAGFHGRQLGFVMQEGTFWRASLWREAGGINRKFRLASDWDLWRRFARLERLYTLTFPLARFSHREEQLSSNMSEYYREVDAIIKLTKNEGLPSETSSFHVTRYWGENRWTITEHTNTAEVVLPVMADAIRRGVRRAARGLQLTGMPLVTIAIVVRNAVAAFADTFQSIEEQTYPNIEIIVVDGGSTDGTLELIREREARITRWISEPDEGPYDGMNKAVRLAIGRWILFMNAGDFFYTPEAVEIALNGVPEQADFIIGHHIYRTIEGVDELHKASDFEDTWRTLTAGNLSFRWLRGVPCHQATFTRTSTLRAEGGYNYKKHPIVADHEFMYRMRSKGARFYHCDEIIAVYLSGGYSWLRPKDIASDWWHVASLYGPRQEVDRFFRVNYPIAVEPGSSGMSGIEAATTGPSPDADGAVTIQQPSPVLKHVLYKLVGWLRVKRSDFVPTQGPFFAFGRRVARRMFPEKRPAWFASAAVIFMIVDGLLRALKLEAAPEAHDVGRGNSQAIER
jgi:glycosyl transferase family 2